MFLRSCVAAFRHYVRTTPASICRTIHGSRLVRTSDGKDVTNDGIGDSNPGEMVTLEVDRSKSVSVIFNKFDGSSIKETAFVNESIYDVVKRVDEEGLIYVGFGMCGGRLVCSTCHVIFDEKDFNKLSPPSEQELDSLDAGVDITDFSRLGCRVYITEEMDGMVFNLPSYTKDARDHTKEGADSESDEE